MFAFKLMSDTPSTLSPIFRRSCSDLQNAVDNLKFHRQVLSLVERKGVCGEVEDMLFQAHDSARNHGNLPQEIDRADVSNAYQRMNKRKFIKYLREKVLEDEIDIHPLVKKVRVQAWAEFRAQWLADTPPNPHLETAMRGISSQKCTRVKIAQCQSMFSAYLVFLGRECPFEVIKSTFTWTWTEYSAFPNLSEEESSGIICHLLYDAEVQHRVMQVGQWRDDEADDYLKNTGLDEGKYRQWLEDEAHDFLRGAWTIEEDLINETFLVALDDAERSIGQGTEGPVSLLIRPSNGNQGQFADALVPSDEEDFA